jgi:hypothetical protein
LAELTRQAKAVQSGDLCRVEELLTARALTLDAIFNQLATRAANAEYLPQLETFLKLALRAQSQPRVIWEAVSAIQNPPIAGATSSRRTSAPGISRSTTALAHGKPKEGRLHFWSNSMANGWTSERRGRRR